MTILYIIAVCRTETKPNGRCGQKGPSYLAAHVQEPAGFFGVRTGTTDARRQANKLSLPKSTNGKGSRTAGFNQTAGTGRPSVDRTGDEFIGAGRQQRIGQDSS